MSEKNSKINTSKIENEDSSLEQFIAVLSHDLRNPLNAITSGAEILKFCGVNERGQEVVDMIQSCVVRMVEMIDSVSDYTRAGLGGGIELVRNDNEPVEGTIRQIVNEIQTTFPDRVIDVDINLSRNIDCDRNRIAQLISNLLRNAINYGKMDKPIRVVAVNDDSNFQLSVSNATAPIPEEKLNKLFQPFERGLSGEHQPGLGLGLYISSEIASAHAGKLEVTYEHEIITFTFYMPIKI